MKLNRTLYLGYYLKKLDWPAFNKFLSYASKHTGKSKAKLMLDILTSVFRYNISLLEYFQFRFFEQTDEERQNWVGTGYMYEYQLQMNPKSERKILDDKRLFYKHYSEFFVHEVMERLALENPDAATRMINLPSGKLVFKESSGKCGAQVQIRENKDFTSDSMVPYMKKNNYGLVEEFIQQHPELNRLSPSAVNTVRIFTQLNNEGEVEILGSRLRISVNSSVDNMAAGNMAAPIDELTGLISGPGVYSDITKEDCIVHPVTGTEIVGFKVPFWNEIIDMVKQAALKHPQNRSIGWDVVVTERGPGLIEGNHDWCKLLWQLPVKQGLKHRLEVHSQATTDKISTNRLKNGQKVKEHVETGV